MSCLWGESWREMENCKTYGWQIPKMKYFYNEDLGMRNAASLYLSGDKWPHLSSAWLFLTFFDSHFSFFFFFFYILVLSRLKRRQWHPTPVLLPGKSHGRRSLISFSPWGLQRVGYDLSDFPFTFHFHALEEEMATCSSVLAWRIPGEGAWWAAFYGVAQSRTRLKRCSSSSSKPGWELLTFLG